MEEFDVGIVGLGALGSAAAYHAAARGVRVIGFEQFELGHVRGASHDTSRIVRTSYDYPEYVALAKAAYKDWAALEQETGVTLLEITGGLVFLSKNGQTTARDFAKSLAANNVPYELLSNNEVRRRWPQFQIPDDMETVYTPDSGIAHASKSVATMQFLARAKGAVLRDRTPVESVTPFGSDGGVVIGTAKGQVRVKKVILAADAWINKLLKPLKAEIPITVMQEQVTYFKPTEPANFESSKFPVWIWGGERWFYGFPCFGEPTIKAARDTSENFMTPEQRTFVHSDELLQQLTDHVDNIMPDKGRKTLRTVTCQYTITPERHFILSPLQHHKDIIVGLGAAHAFKFAPAIGRVLVELALDGGSTEDLSLFGIPKPEASPIASKL